MTNEVKEVDVIEPVPTATLEALEKPKVKPVLKWIAAILGIGFIAVVAPVAWSLFKPTLAASGPIEAISVVESVETPIFTIDAESSEARFLIDEVLRGEDVTVIGATNQVAAELAFDLANPKAADLGTILVNVRDLATDNEFRDRAIKNAILFTDEYEYVSFTPTEITGFPATASVGDSFAIEIAGVIAIADMEIPATFDTDIRVVSEGELVGVASTTFNYADFGIEIPFSRSVDWISDLLTLELAFTAITAEADS